MPMTVAALSQRLVLILGIIVLVSAALTASAQAWPIEEWERWNAASSTNYPGRNWDRYATPEEAGWSAQGLADAESLSKKLSSAAVVVVYDGAVLAEWGDVERRYMCHSIRKSLLSALYGIAVSRGQIDLEETLGAIGIEDKTALTESEKSAKVSDLLKARSGVYLPAAYETESMRKARPARGSHAPGSHWYYNNWDFNVLASIYNRKTEGDLFEAFKMEIADPLQMQDFDLRHTYYHLEPEHSQHPAYPFRMSARDLARFGLLYLNKGKWQDSQIIPSAWVEESTAPHSEARRGGYGYMWWTDGGRLGELGTYRAAGYGGQWIYVIPKAKLVVVHRADTYEDKHVDFISMRTILSTILNARTGPPSANPQLVEIPSTPREPEAVLTSSELTALTGTYRRDATSAEVYEAAGGLELESPKWGRYALIPRSATEFLAEDIQVRLTFVLDAAGKAKGIQIWLEPEAPYEMRRAP